MFIVIPFDTKQLALEYILDETLFYRYTEEKGYTYVVEVQYFVIQKVGGINTVSIPKGKRLTYSDASRILIILVLIMAMIRIVNVYCLNNQKI